jgi:hypothetical protein
MPQLTKAPSVDVGMLIRRSPHDVFEALADPSITTRFWYTKSTGRMVEDAELTWEWEMYGTSGKVWVKEVQATGASASLGRVMTLASHHGRVPVHIQYENDTTYVRIMETGFTGDADTHPRPPVMRPWSGPGWACRPSPARGPAAGS